MKTLTKAAFLSAVLLLAAAPAKSVVTEYVVPSGPLITLQDGRTIDGHVVGIDQTNVVVQSNDGVSETLPRSTIRTVTFKTVTGSTLTGELVGWTSGVYQIATPEAAIKIHSTMPQVVVPAEPIIAADDGKVEEVVVEDIASDDVVDEEDVAAEDVTAEEVVEEEAQAATTEDAGQGNSQTIAAVTVDEANANGIAEPSDDVAEVQDAAATPTSDVRIQVSVENSKENGPPIAFNIALSKAAESSVVLIYATIDGTAINGQDYEPNRGVVVIKPGEQTARIEAPVIDDDEKEEQEHLQLFLTVDPTVAVVENRQIIATIDDDDQG